MKRTQAGPPAVPRIDRDALVVALVLAPATYSRNRFFELYTDPSIRQVRRRASMIRSVTRQLANDRRDAPVIQSIEPLENGMTAIAYEVPSLGLKRTTRVSAVELAAMRVALQRSGHAPKELHASDADRALVDAALVRLAPSRRQRSSAPPPEG